MTEIDKSLPHYGVRVFLAGLRQKAGPEADAEIARLLGWPSGPKYSTDLNPVLGELQRLGWWWNLSHIIAGVCPTSDAGGALEGLVSNATRYDREGRPIFYEDHFAGDCPALALCNAAIKAVYDLPSAFYVNASHMEEVLGREPRSRKFMMAYYRAREDHRQEAIIAHEARPQPLPDKTALPLQSEE